MHKRQYIPHRRDGFYEVLKWRSHAAKFAQWQNAQMRQTMQFLIFTDPKLETHQKTREMLGKMLVGSSFLFRLKVWSTIYAARLMNRLRGALSFRPRRRATA